MKTWGIAREILIHLVPTLLVAALIVLWKGYYINSNLLVPFSLGIAFGMFLPDIDYLIYVFFMRPTDLSSQRIAQKVQTRSFASSLALLYETRLERRELIFHSAFFQVIFIVFAFLIVSSSGSLFGKGVVIAFLLHLFIDQISDLKYRGNIERWFVRIPVVLTPQQVSWYVYAQVLPVFILGFLY